MHDAAEMTTRRAFAASTDFRTHSRSTAARNIEKGRGGLWPLWSTRSVRGLPFCDKICAGLKPNADPLSRAGHGSRADPPTLGHGLRSGHAQNAPCLLGLQAKCGDDFLDGRRDAISIEQKECDPACSLGSQLPRPLDG